MNLCRRSKRERVHDHHISRNPLPLSAPILNLLSSPIPSPNTRKATSCLHPQPQPPLYKSNLMHLLLLIIPNLIPPFPISSHRTPTHTHIDFTLSPFLPLSPPSPSFSSSSPPLPHQQFISHHVYLSLSLSTFSHLSLPLLSLPPSLFSSHSYPSSHTYPILILIPPPFLILVLVRSIYLSTTLPLYHSTIYLLYLHNVYVIHSFTASKIDI